MGGATHDVLGAVVDVAGGAVVDVVDVEVDVDVDEVVGAPDPPGDPAHAESTRPATVTTSADAHARRTGNGRTLLAAGRLVAVPTSSLQHVGSSGGRAWVPGPGSPQAGRLAPGGPGP